DPICCSAALLLCALLFRPGGPRAPGPAQYDMSLPFELVPEHPRRPEPSEQPGFFESVGGFVIDAASAARELASVVRRGVFGMVAWATGREKARGGPIMEQAVIIGADAVFIVALLGTLMGVILAFQAAYQLRKFGSVPFMAEVVGLGMVREFGAVMTAIILAGRSGAAMAAELGTMRINDETAALETMGIDPVRYLVLPRVIAITLVCPLLTILASAVGIAGGIAIAPLVDVPAWVAYQRMADVLMPRDFVLAFIKSLLFAWIVGFTGCFLGLRTRGGAHAVGGNTTRAVVVSIVLIVVTDSIATTIWTLGAGDG
ncbi:MAG: ABC transporter permease, partial [Myxococcota bacterium]